MSRNGGDLGALQREKAELQTRLKALYARWRSPEFQGSAALRTPAKSAAREAMHEELSQAQGLSDALGVQIYNLNPADPGAVPPASAGVMGLRMLGMDPMLGMQGRMLAQTYQNPAALEHALAGSSFRPPTDAQLAALSAPSASAGLGAAATVPPILRAQAATDNEAEKQRRLAERTAEIQRSLDYEAEHMDMSDPEGLGRMARQLAEAEEARHVPPAPPIPRPALNANKEYLRAGAPTTADMTFAGTPMWYGGDQGAQKQVIEQAFHNFNTPFETYGGYRHAPFSRSERNAAKLIQTMAGDPAEAQAFREARTRANEAGDTSVLDSAVNRYLQPGTGGLTAADFANLRNPHEEEVIDRYLDKSNRNFFEHILPHVKTSYAARGALHSGARLNAVQRAVERHEEEQGAHMAGLLHKGYEHTSGLLERHKGRQLQGAEMAGKTAESDLARRLEAVRTGQDLSTAHHHNERLNIDALQQLGGKFRAHQQQGLNTLHEDWKRQKEHPYAQVRELSEIVNRHPPTQQVRFGTPSATPHEVPVSPFTVAGAGLGQLIGSHMLNRKQDAKGGRINKAYGGDLAEIPERIELMNQLKQRSQELQNNQQKPFWGWFTNMMSGIGQHAAKNPKAGVVSAAGNSLPYAMQGYNDVENANEARRDKSLELQDMIVKSQIMQQEREEKKKQMHEQFRLQELVTNAKLNYLTQKAQLKGAGPSKGNNTASAKEIEQANEDIRKYSNMLNELGHMEGISKKSKALGSPLIAATKEKEGEPSWQAGLKKFARQKAFGKELPDIEAFEKSSPNLALSRNTRNESEFKAATAGTPRAELTANSIKQLVKGQKEEAEKGINKARFIIEWHNITKEPGAENAYLNFSKISKHLSPGSLKKQIQEYVTLRNSGALDELSDQEELEKKPKIDVIKEILSTASESEIEKVLRARGAL